MSFRHVYICVYNLIYFLLFYFQETNQGGFLQQLVRVYILKSLCSLIHTLIKNFFLLKHVYRSILKFECCLGILIF